MDKILSDADGAVRTPRPTAARTRLGQHANAMRRLAKPREALN
jgi:hypothetical protein